MSFTKEPAPAANATAKLIYEIKNLEVNIALAIGGGNIVRGSIFEKYGSERTRADYMGMLATVINSLAMQNALEHHGIHTRVMTAISMTQLAEPYIRRRAVRHLEKERIIIIAGGTGNPYFTTDTAVAVKQVDFFAAMLYRALLS